MKIRAQGVARGSALIVTGAAALVLGVGGPAFAGGSDPDSNGDVHSNCHTGSKMLGAGGEDTHGPNAEGDNCQQEAPQPPPPPVQPGQPPMQPGQQVTPPKAVAPAAQAPAKVAATVAGPIPTAVEAGQHTTDSWTVPLGTGLVTLGAAGSAAALVTRRRTAQR